MQLILSGASLCGESIQSSLGLGLELLQRILGVFQLKLLGPANVLNQFNLGLSRGERRSMLALAALLDVVGNCLSIELPLQ